jgi:hypothetical protein
MTKAGAAPADQAAELARKLANPANPKYDEKLLAAMNQKLNALIAEEIGEDKAMFTPPKN